MSIAEGRNKFRKARMSKSCVLTSTTTFGEELAMMDTSVAHVMLEAFWNTRKELSLIKRQDTI